MKRYGEPLARALYRESVDATALVAGLITDQGIDAELRLNGYLELGLGTARRRGVAGGGRRRCGTSARRRERSRRPTSATRSGPMPITAGSPWTVAGCSIRRSGSSASSGLAERAGAELHEGVRVRSLRRQADHRFVVETGRGAILAKDVLVATNGYTDGVAPAVRRRVIPIGSYIIATEPLAPDLAREMSPGGRAYFDTRNFLSYWHVSADRRMIFGGRVSFFPTSVDRTARLLYRRLLEIHPQLAGTRVEYSWGGKVGITMDRMPHIGRTAGVMYAVGYSGTGVVLSTYLGHAGGRVARWRSAPGAREAALPARAGAVRGPAVVPAGRRRVVPDEGPPLSEGLTGPRRREASLPASSVRRAPQA